MNVTIIKYNAGNIRSVLFALERIGVLAEVTDDPQEISASDKIIFPGVGEASTAMSYLRERKLDQVIRNLKQPTLGICLGMQLLCRHSEENDTECMGIMDCRVRKFPPPSGKGQGGGLKVPQIGWNTISNLKGPLFKGISENSFMYFVHGYYAEQNKFSAATTTYILDYSSAVQKDNFYAVQFHPEKSSTAGQKILENFLAL